MFGYGTFAELTFAELPTETGGGTTYFQTVDIAGEGLTAFAVMAAKGIPIAGEGSVLVQKQVGKRILIAGDGTCTVGKSHAKGIFISGDGTVNVLKLVGKFVNIEGEGTVTIDTDVIPPAPGEVLHALPFIATPGPLLAR